jgi:hypothetical protein
VNILSLHPLLKPLQNEVFGNLPSRDLRPDGAVEGAPSHRIRIRLSASGVDSIRAHGIGVNQGERVPAHSLKLTPTPGVLLFRVDLQAGFDQLRATGLVGSFGNLKQLLEVEPLRLTIAHLFCRFRCPIKRPKTVGFLSQS